MILRPRFQRKRRKFDGMVKVRLPCQAGAFYEGTTESLIKQIRGCFLHNLGPGRLPETVATPPRNIVGLICPHAGYMFSGPVAAHAYYSLALDGTPDVVVILGPNHTGYGSAIATVDQGFWRTPLGDVEIAGGIANQIARESRIVDIDDSAHRFEHSIEVQLPFLQYVFGSRFKMIPICLLMQDLSSAKEVGQALAKVLADKSAVVIASSDMTHYEKQERAAKNDKLALEAAEAMDEVKFYSVIETHGVSACGYGPIAAVIAASKAMGAKEAKLLCYKTSGDVVGDYSQKVVGYAAVCFTK
jgi:AmmeMemoRadiSam system protein B